ncbi:MAG: SAM-dependent methyltransferase [Burkholderiales bacterium]
MNRRECIASSLALLSAACGPQAVHVSQEEEEAAAKPKGERFSLFVPTPERAARRMLDLARVGPNDLVLDLGSGDGRIPILAAQRYGARGWGVDIDPALVAKSISQAKRLTLTNRVVFEHGDAMSINPREASVVTMYLFPSLMSRLKPILIKHLRPGTRIVSYEYTFSDWPPEETLHTYVPEHYQGVGADVSIRLWVVPANFSGAWSGMIAAPMESPIELTLQQHFQRIKGSIHLHGKNHALSMTHVHGDEIEFAFGVDGVQYHLHARLADGQLAGEVRNSRDDANAKHSWRANRTGAPSQMVMKTWDESSSRTS